VILRGHGFNSSAALPGDVRPATRGIPTRGTERTKSSTSGNGFTAFPPAALIARN
jgi:hypothetical protein